MSNSKELNEFDRGSIVGCHLCGKSVREIVDILQKPKSTEFRSLSGITVSSRTVLREFKNLGFHGRAVAHKPNTTPQNAKHRLQWCRAHRPRTVDMWKTVLWSDESRFIQSGSRMDTSGLAQTWFDKMGVQKLDWPSQSPMELLWDELECRLHSQPNRSSSLKAFTSAVMDAWKAIPMVTNQKLVDRLSSMQTGKQHHINMGLRML
ncbi:uncharacterized protein TNCV_2397431 [Trichonephila clavipes]|uniref:Transposase Tc1-like domain-containing protein n=1 Tax=Trichonephila clavipes TaxID=2585209 RepID=A0A8X6T250_TRICX|nr:uncharacterized protein TNCV_2397431 [Trichonephila clavipes]